MACGEDDKIDYIINAAQNILPNVTITRHELEQPTSNFVINFYENFRASVIKEISNVWGDDDILVKNVINESDYLFVLYHHISHWFNKVSPETVSLTLTDLYEPTSKRAVIRFSVLLHFLNFIIKSITFLKDITTNRKERQAKYNSKKNQNEKCRQQIGFEAEQLARNEDEVSQLENDLKHANFKKTKLKEEEDDSTRETEKMKNDLRDRLHTFSTKNTHIENIKTAISELNSQIVNSGSYTSLLDLKEFLLSKYEELKKVAQSNSENLNIRKPGLEKFQIRDKSLDGHLLNLEKFRSTYHTVDNKIKQLNGLSEDIELKYNQYQNHIMENEKYAENIKMQVQLFKSLETEHHNFVKKCEHALRTTTDERLQEADCAVAVNVKKTVVEEEINKRKNACELLSTDLKKLQTFYDETYKSMLETENSVVDHFSTALKKLETGMRIEE